MRVAEIGVSSLILFTTSANRSRRNRRSDVLCIVFETVPEVIRTVGILFRGGIWESAHAMKGQGLDRIGEWRVGFHRLLVTIGINEERTMPAARQLGETADIEFRADS